MPLLVVYSIRFKNISLKQNVATNLKTEISNILRVLLKQNYFESNNKIFYSTVGLIEGNPLSLNLI